MKVNSVNDAWIVQWIVY